MKKYVFGGCLALIAVGAIVLGFIVFPHNNFLSYFGVDLPYLSMNVSSQDLVIVQPVVDKELAILRSAVSNDQAPICKDPDCAQKALEAYRNDSKELDEASDAANYYGFDVSPAPAKSPNY